MKKIILAFVTLFALCAAEKESTQYPSEFGNMRSPCIRKVMAQIGCEVRASLEYLKFGAHYSQDIINRPGFSKFFFESASEEREHAIKLIEYLNMRGAHHPDANVNELGEYKALLEHSSNCSIFNEIFSKNNCNALTNGISGLTCALQMEIAVTAHINDLIRTCEETKATDPTSCSKAKDNNVQCNDYHVSLFVFKF